MKEYRSHTRASRSPRRHMLLALLALLVIGGGTFAATGGVQKLRQWLVTVEIGGQVHEFTTDDNGIGTFTIETEDGGQAEVQIEVASSAEGDETQTVQITAQSPCGDATQDVEMRRRQMMLGGDEAGDAQYTTDDLGDAEPVAEWENDGLANAVYLVPNAEDEGEGFKVFIASTDADGETTVSLAAAPPVALPDDEDAVNAELGDDGLLTLTITSGEGMEMVMKFMVAADTGTNPGCCDPDEPLTVGTPDGEITITLEAQEAEDDE